MNRTLCSSLLLLTLALGANAQEIVLDQIATGLENPVAITHAGDNRLFITLQRGVVMVYDGTRVLPTPFLDIRHLVRSTGSEQGLLSIAFHPRYSQNGFFFVNYTDLNGDTVVARFRVSGDPNRADTTTLLPILFIDQPFANHNGGQLQFGPDGYLYIGMGDGGSANDPGNRAQNLSDLLGKMLRIDVDSGQPYAIPPSNPFVTRPGARGEIWSYGLRNPWRFSFDRASGDLWIADVGQGLWEELDFQGAGSIGGENYGWRRMEGLHCFIPSSGCNDGTLILPVHEYGHTGGACSVTGGYVYRGGKYPRLHGTYVFADFCTGVISGAVFSPGGALRTRKLADSFFLVSTFGEDAAGELYVADYANGRLFAIRDPRPDLPRRRAVRH